MSAIEERNRSLREMYRLLSPPERWIQGVLCADRWGRELATDDPKASCFCLLGAVRKVGAPYSVIKALRWAVGPHHRNDDSWVLVEWQDAAGRTHAEILQLLIDAEAAPL